MKKFMITYVEDGEQYAIFKDDYNDAAGLKQDISCGLGCYAEIYERKNTGHGGEYVLLEA